MPVPGYITLLFIGLTIVIFGFLLQGINRGLEQMRHTNMRGVLILTAVGVLGWLLLTAALASKGFFKSWNSFPPKPFFLIIAPTIAILLAARTKGFKKMVQGIPLAWPIYLQSFRIVVEIILWRLFVARVIPEQMTFEGLNFDVLSGILALPVAYFCFTKKQWPVRIAIYYNMLGLALLLTIVVIAVLSMPTPMRVFMNNPANTFIADFPFVWLPGFLVPMALFFHVISLKQLMGQKSRS